MALINFPSVAGDGSAGGSSIVLPWMYGPYPVGANQAVVTASPQIVWVWSADADDPMILDDPYLKLSWTSIAQGGVVRAGAHIAIGQFIKLDNIAGIDDLKLKVRLKVNNTARLSYVILHIGDTVSAFYEKDYVLASMSNDTWYDAETAAVDVSGWDPFIRCSVTARGTDNSNNVGLTEVYIARMRFEWS